MSRCAIGEEFREKGERVMRVKGGQPCPVCLLWMQRMTLPGLSPYIHVPSKVRVQKVELNRWGQVLGIEEASRNRLSCLWCMSRGGCWGRGSKEDHVFPFYLVSKSDFSNLAFKDMLNSYLLQLPTWTSLVKLITFLRTLLYTAMKTWFSLHGYLFACSLKFHVYFLTS